MRLDQIAGVAVEHLLGRIIRRALLALAMAIFAVVAIYYFTAAGILALAMQFGELEALLIVGAIYTAAGGAALGVFWVMGAKPAASTPIPADKAREMQLVMLVEAVMLGYSLARKRAPAR